MIIAVACNMDRRTIISVGSCICQIILKNINDLSDKVLRAFPYQTCSAFAHFYSPLIPCDDYLLRYQYGDGLVGCAVFFA